MKVILAMVAIAMFSGCANRMGNFTVLSTKNCDLNDMNAESNLVQSGVEGSSGRLWILFIPFGPEPEIEEAVDECLNRQNCDYLKNAVVYHVDWTALLFGYDGWTVKGDICRSGKGKKHKDS